MRPKLLVVLVSVVFISSCTFAALSTPQPPATIPSPTSTPAPPAAAVDLLTDQVSGALSAYPRPACQPGTIPGKEWDTYREGLASALRLLFSDSRSQSLPLKALAVVFKQGSGLSLDVHESNADVILVSILNSNCHERIGGGDSPVSPRDTAYVLNRHGGLWQIAQVETVMKAVWAEDRWIVLVTKTLWGGGQEFEIWFVRQIAGEWKEETKLQFTQLYSVPLPALSADGNAVTLYSRPAACNLPESFTDPSPIIESDYKWQDGQYRCTVSRVIPTSIPTRTP